VVSVSGPIEDGRRHLAQVAIGVEADIPSGVTLRYSAATADRDTLPLLGYLGTSPNFLPERLKLLQTQFGFYYVWR
jgi:hypothetical protein